MSATHRQRTGAHSRFEIGNASWYSTMAHASICSPMPSRCWTTTAVPEESLPS